MTTLSPLHPSSSHNWLQELESRPSENSASWLNERIQSLAFPQLQELWRQLGENQSWSSNHGGVLGQVRDATELSLCSGRLTFVQTQRIATQYRKIAQFIERKRVFCLAGESSTSLQHLSGHRILVASASHSLFEKTQSGKPVLIEASQWRKDYFQELVRLTESPLPFRGMKNHELMLSSQAKRFLEDMKATEFLSKREIQHSRLSMELAKVDVEKALKEPFVMHYENLAEPAKILLTSSSEQHLKLRIVPFQHELPKGKYDGVAPLVTHLELSDWALGKRSTSAFLAQASSLRKITVDLSGLKTAGDKLRQPLPQIRIIKLSGGSKPDIKSLQALIECCPNVTRLDLTDCKGLDGETIAELCRPLKTLRHLCLRGTNLRDQDLSLIASAQKYESLISLDLSHCCYKVDPVHYRYLDGSGLSAWAKATVHLELLNLHGSQGLLPKYLHALLPHLSSLKALYLQKCARVSDETLELLSKHCRALSKLNLNECRQITGEGVNRLLLDLRFEVLYYKGQNLAS